MIPIGREEHLGRKTLVIMMLQGALPGVFLLVIVAVLYFFRDAFVSGLTSNLNEFQSTISLNISYFIPLVIPFIFFLAILVGCLGIVMNALQYKFFTFKLEEFGLKLKRGVFNVEEITIPYRQMQDVDVTRPLLYRIFGISRLVVISAGHEKPGEPDETNTIFDPMDSEIAEEIRLLLGRRIGVQVIEHEREADREEKEEMAKPVADL